VQADILWEGNKPLTYFQFNLSRVYDHQIPENELEQSKVIWDTEKQKFPQIYDGNLVYIDKMTINSSIEFNAGIMKYSSLVYLARTNQSFKGRRGYLSFKIILYYKKGTVPRYLVGLKSSQSQFGPDNWTMPGGMVETKAEDIVDLSYSAKQEIIEETGIKDIKNQISCHLLTKGSRNLGICMILSLEIDPKVLGSIRENEEFEPSSFHWLQGKEILQLSDETIYNDVAALKYLIRNNKI